MSVVVDASIAIGQVAEDADDPRVVRAFELVGSGRGIVPAHWPIEVANGLLMAVRRGRFDESVFIEAEQLLMSFDWSIQVLDLREIVLRCQPLATKHQLTMYDATYLELAVRFQLPLATLDRALIRAALVMGVQLVGREPA